jgi:predicted enzyme related to lactoylglutathione lyase
MARRLAGFMIDCQGEDLATARSFWSGALGLPVLDPDEGGDGRYALLGKGPGGWHLETQCVDHESRIHLDIEATDIDAEVARLETLGATRVDKPRGTWMVMQAPTGQRFCVVRWRGDGERKPARALQAGRGHHSVLIAIVIDCNGNLGAAVDFWSAALDRTIASRDQDGDGKYAELATSSDEPFVLLQRVDHAPRIHLDIETDDLDAETSRLEALGATRVAFVKRWWVMQAPTGQRFCVVRQQPAKSGITRNRWPKA